MPVDAQVEDKQSFEVTIQGPDGANRMIVCTGKLRVFLNAFDNTATGTGIVQKETFTALIDPQLEAGQFKRAIAVASLAGIGYRDNDAAQPDSANWLIEEAQADFDDESGKVELRVSLNVNPRGIGSSATISHVSFQVTTIAAVQGE
jgi:hypothetical protein